MQKINTKKVVREVCSKDKYTKIFIAYVKNANYWNKKRMKNIKIGEKEDKK